MARLEKNIDIGKKRAAAIEAQLPMSSIEEKKLLDHESKEVTKKMNELEREKQTHLFSRKVLACKNACTIVTIVASGLENLAKDRKNFQKYAPILGQTVQVAQTGVAAAEIVYNIINWTALSAASGPLFPLVGICGAAKTIAEVWGFGPPSDRDVILDAVANLSKQMTDMEETIQKGFKATFEALQVVDHNSQLRFEALQRTLLAGFKEIFSGLQNLGKGMEKLGDKIQNVAHDLELLNAHVYQLETALAELYDQNYELLVAKMRDMCVNPKISISEKEVSKFISVIHTRATMQASKEILAGRDISAGKIEPEIISSDLRKKSIWKNINLLKCCAVAYAADFGGIRFVSPQAWCDAVLNLVNFISRVPTISLELDVYHRNFQEILEQGEILQKFILELKANPQFLIKLISDYRQSLQQFRNALKEIIISQGKFDSAGDLKRKIAAQWPVHAQLEIIKGHIVEKNEMLATIGRDMGRLEEEKKQKHKELEQATANLTGKKKEYEEAYKKDMDTFAPGVIFFFSFVPVLGQLVAPGAEMSAKKQCEAADERVRAIMRLNESVINSTKELESQTQKLAILAERKMLVEVAKTELEQSLNSLQSLVDEAENKEEDAIFSDYIKMVATAEENNYMILLGTLIEQFKMPSSAAAQALTNIELRYRLLIAFVALLFNEEPNLQQRCQSLLGKDGLLEHFEKLRGGSFDAQQCAAQFIGFYLQEERFTGITELEKLLLRLSIECKNAQECDEQIISYRPIDQAVTYLKRVLLISEIRRMAQQCKPFDTPAPEEASHKDKKRRLAPQPSKASFFSPPSSCQLIGDFRGKEFKFNQISTGTFDQHGVAGSCGFNALGISREEMQKILLGKVDDPAIREQIAKQIDNDLNLKLSYLPSKLDHKIFERLSASKTSLNECEDQCNLVISKVIEQMKEDFAYDFQTKTPGIIDLVHALQTIKAKPQTTEEQSEKISKLIQRLLAARRELQIASDAYNSYWHDRELAVDYLEKCIPTEWLGIHIAIAWAIATNRTLRIWQHEDDGTNANKIVVRDGFFHINTSDTRPPIDIIYTNGSTHFERLELVKVPMDAPHPMPIPQVPEGKPMSYFLDSILGF